MSSSCPTKMVPFRRSSLTFVNTESAVANSLLLSSVTLANIFSSVPGQVENRVKTAGARFSPRLCKAQAVPNSLLVLPHFHTSEGHSTSPDMLLPSLDSAFAGKTSQMSLFMKRTPPMVGISQESHVARGFRTWAPFSMLNIILKPLHAPILRIGAGEEWLHSHPARVTQTVLRGCFHSTWKHRNIHVRI